MNDSEMIDEMADRIEKLEMDTANNLEAIAEHAERIVELERLVSLQHKRIEELETAMQGLTATETTKALGCRVEKLETALRDMARCLIDGKVDMAAPIPDEFHGHRILSGESI